MSARQLADTEIGTLASINDASNSSALLFLTAVGLEKGILDATEPVRRYLVDRGFHSFDEQATGPGSKVTKCCRIVLDEAVVQTTIALYRPATKKGDPRLWIYGLRKYAAPDDVLSLAVKGGNLFVFNLSKLQPLSRMAVENSFLDYINSAANSVNSEEASLTRKIAEPESNNALNAVAVSLNSSHDAEEENASRVNEAAELYPAGLLNWAGHRSGGVRKPFLPNSGRPTGDRLETPLLTRIRVWIDDLVSGVRDTPRSLLLVGGPGNGKTDAIESCIELFDQRLGASGAIYNAFSRQFREVAGLPPRRVLVDLRTLGIDLPESLKTSIALIQDATEGDPNEDATAEELLLSELATRLDANESTIYLCCVNRGILAQAATVAHKHPRGQDVESLVTQITRAVTSGPDQLRCWPLDGYDRVAVWPMDVESLVDGNAQETTVAHQIFRVALDERRWTRDCVAGSRCPFCWNRRTLSQRDTLNALIRQLRFYELASGKRWTFRDLFSLVPYLLVGDASELRIKDKGYQPCEWAAKQLEFSKENSQASNERAYAPYLLVSRLFHHRLFGRWPALDSGTHRRAKETLGGDATKPGLQATRDLFRYLSRRAKLRSTAGSDIGEILEHPVSDCLDPALASGTEEILCKSGGEAYSCSDIEELFSISVSEGLEVTKNQLAPLERDLLSSLVMADEVLVDENFAKNDSHHVRLLQGSVRQFAARITKRSLGVRQGLCLHFSVFEKYAAITEGEHDLNSIRRQMTRLLHGDGNSFSASLVTTFGQPVASRNREIRLMTRRVSVREIRREDSSGRPRDSLPYLQVAETVVPMTFPLFKALEEVNSGLHQASLPAEIFTLLNGVKSLVSGRLVRDELMLQDDARIIFGAVPEQVEVLDGQFRVSGRDIS